MSRYLEELEECAEDMARTIRALRSYFMEIAEQHPDMDTSALDAIVRRYDRLMADDEPSGEQA